MVVVSTPGVQTATALPCMLRMNYLPPLYMAEGGTITTPECESRTEEKRGGGGGGGVERARAHAHTETRQQNILPNITQTQENECVL